MQAALYWGARSDTPVTLAELDALPTYWRDLAEFCQDAEADWTNPESQRVIAAAAEQ